MDGLTIFGLTALTAGMLGCALEDRSPWFIRCFAIACILGSSYGFLQGAWPFRIIEAIWALIAFMRFYRQRSGE